MHLLSQIALTLTPGLGPTSIRRLVDIYPDEDIFALPHSELLSIFGSHRNIADAIINKSAFARAEQELRFIEQNNLRALFFTDPDFPRRLNQPETQDCPVLLYVQGQLDLNPERSLAVVGTRRATSYGRDTADHIVGQLKPLNTTIVSGLAYGIDTAAHAAAVSHGLPTAAVLGHGLDIIYPSQNRRLAEQILAAGGALISEYPSGTAINPRNFPARNRIIAALADATVVVEASEKGGALITATIASGYCRDVFALPGRVTDTYSSGTNNLIATNKAIIIRSADDIVYHLGWPPLSQNENNQQSLFPTLAPQEQKLVDLLHKNCTLSLDQLASLSDMSMAKVASIIFNLEMQKMVRALPGRLYEAAI